MDNDTTITTTTADAATVTAQMIACYGAGRAAMSAQYAEEKYRDARRDGDFRLMICRLDDALRLWREAARCAPAVAAYKGIDDRIAYCAHWLDNFRALWDAKPQGGFGPGNLIAQYIGADKAPGYYDDKAAYDAAKAEWDARVAGMIAAECNAEMPM